MNDMRPKTWGKHAKPCIKCGAPTYRTSVICKHCDGRASAAKRLPNPSILPEDYLMECSRELLRRHVKRAELLAAIGVEMERAA